MPLPVLTPRAATAANGATPPPPVAKPPPPPGKRGPGRPRGSKKNDDSKKAAADVITAGSVADDLGPSAKKFKSSSLEQPPVLNPEKKFLASPSSTTPDVLKTLSLPPNPRTWSVDQVCDFVRRQPHGEDFVDEFQSQEIDGQALLLLEIEHLREVMNMKLGKAVKIWKAIKEMKEAAAAASASTSPASVKAN